MLTHAMYRHAVSVNKFIYVALCVSKPGGDPSNVVTSASVDCPRCLEWVHG